MDMTWYTSLAGIITATLTIVEILKRVLANAPKLHWIPTWAYAVLVAAVLTYCANTFWHTLPGGNVWDLVSQAIISAATASGFKEWVANADKPIGASTAAIDRRSNL